MENTAEEIITSDLRRKNVMELLARKAKTGNNLGVPTHPPRNARSRGYNMRDFSSYPEVKALKGQKKVISDCGVANPYFRINEAITGSKTVISGKEFISYSGYNYLGLSGDAFVSRRAKEAIDRYGTSPSASRLVTGEKPVHGELESAIADFIGTETALVFPSGHATNVTVIGHFFNSQDLIVYDELSHNSVIEGCLLSGARRIPFPHNDVRRCRQIISENVERYEKVVVIIEGAYSMDGDLAPLPEFVELRNDYSILLYVDEAHSFGTVGKTGRGVAEYFDVEPHSVDFWMGTLSKSLASNGGYIAGRKDLIDYLKYTTPGFVYTAGITPANAAAALASLDLIRRQPERVAKLQSNADFFRARAAERGLNIGPSKNTPIVPIIVGESDAAIVLADKLFQQGISVHPIFYPTVPMGEARLRFFVSSSHTEQELAFTVNAIAKCIS